MSRGRGWSHLAQKWYKTALQTIAQFADSMPFLQNWIRLKKKQQAHE